MAIQERVLNVDPGWQAPAGAFDEQPAAVGNTNHGFPWTREKPTRKQRLIVAGFLALLAGIIVFGDFERDPSRQTDFGQVRFGAQAILEGRNPYDLVGPGLEYEHEYPLFYPATTFVAALPFTVLSARNAAIALVTLSTFLLGYGMTRESWHLLPLFPSAAFIDSVHAAQWTILLTAALFLPWLAFFVAVKPQSGGAVLAGTSSRTAWIAALSGALVLTASSLVWLPHWPIDWLARIRVADHIRAPITGPLGPLVVFVLLRWRRPEAWLVLASACLPQTFMWYSSLMLLAIAATYREACVLSLLSTAGFALTLLVIEKNPPNVRTVMWAVFICSTYIPVVVAILRRPNVGSHPVWLEACLRFRQGSRI